MYHSIGRQGFASYRWDNFKKDILAISARDFWVASMNDITLYILEKEKTQINIKKVKYNGTMEQLEVTLSDGLDNQRFDQPLTLIFTPPLGWAGLSVKVTQNGKVVDWMFLGKETALISLRPNEQPYIFKPWYPEVP